MAKEQKDVTNIK